MYYCDECREKNEWPESLAQSKGTCESCGKHGVCHDRPASQLPISKVKLGEYATDDGLYFSFDNCVYVTKGNGWSAGDVGVERWDDGGTRWMAAETMVEALEVPPRPTPPGVPTRTRHMLKYVRQAEAYMSALEKQSA